MIDYLSKRYSNRNPYFEAMLKEGTNTSPIGAHSQGWSRLAHALLAGLERGQMDREDRGRLEQAQGKREPSDQQADSPMPLSSPEEVAGSAAAGAAAFTPPASPVPYPVVGGMSPFGRARAGIRYNPLIGRRG
jgi:hypothetical protein